MGLTAMGAGGLTLWQSLGELGKVGESWWLWMPLPTTVTIPLETEKTPPLERGARISLNPHVPDKPGDFGFHFGVHLVGGREPVLLCLAQTRLSPKQWTDFEHRVSRQECVWGMPGVSGPA